MDFIEGLPMSYHNNSILVMVDRLTKYGEFIPLKHPYSAQEVVEVFLKEVYKLHGLPQSIMTDLGSVFTSHFWQHLFKGLGTKLNLTTAYHPQSDGQTERLNRYIKNYLRAIVFSKPRQWMKWLHLAEWWYNTNHHSALKVTPFEALYEFPPP